MNEEEKTLNLDDVKFLLEKITRSTAGGKSCHF